jgi:DNA-3-methyladenine glycosylase II
MALKLERESTEFVFTLESPEAVALCAADKRLSWLIHRYGELRYSLHTEAFPFFVETIIGQMLSNKAADTIAARLYDACGGKLTPLAVLKLELAAFKVIGLSGFKAEYIQRMATLLIEEPGYFDDLASLTDVEVIRRLTTLRGIGTWSAKMYLIFALNRLDVLPYEDGAFLQAYKWLYETEDTKPVSIVKRCEPWKPYSSLAARYLYRALDAGLVKTVRYDASGM